jgi:hypothetical protein
VKAIATSERDACLPPVGVVRTGILRHAGAVDRAMARKGRILPGLGKELPAGNMGVTASAQDDDTRMVDMGKVPGIDIPSGETGRAQM